MATMATLIYYREANVDFIKDITPDTKVIDEGTYVIVRNKNAKDFNNLYNYEIIKQGKKYSLYKNTHLKAIK